jgi:bifunctional non-homologous end joining protein LigD
MSSLRLRALPAGFVAPCLPTRAPRPPSGAIWLHEIKWDGFRVIARKEGNRVRLYSRPGNDLTHRFPLIVEALGNLRCGPALSTGKPSCVGMTASPRSIVSGTAGMMQMFSCGRSI